MQHLCPSERRDQHLCGICDKSVYGTLGKTTSRELEVVLHCVSGEMSIFLVEELSQTYM